MQRTSVKCSKKNGRVIQVEVWKCVWCLLIDLVCVFQQAWSAARKGDEEKTKYSWKRYRIWNTIAAIWVFVGGILLAITTTVALYRHASNKYPEQYND